MATLFSSATRLTSLLAVLAVSASLAACTPKPNGPATGGRRVLRGAGQGRHRRCVQLTDRPEDARAALNEAWAGLQATSLDAQVLGSKFAEDTGTVAYRYTWHLPKNRTWSYDGQLSMVRNEGNWEVRWTTTGLHPNSVSTRRLRCVRTHHGAHRSMNAAGLTCRCRATCTSSRWTQKRGART